MNYDSLQQGEILTIRRMSIDKDLFEIILTSILGKEINRRYCFLSWLRGTDNIVDIIRHNPPRTILKIKE